MKNKLSELAARAAHATTSAASRTKDYVQAHKPTEQDLAQANIVAKAVGTKMVNAAVDMGKEAAQSKTFKDAAKGAGAGAIVAIPVPLIGPALGAIVGAGVGVFLGRKQAAAKPSKILPPAFVDAQPTVMDVEALPVKDLYVELLKLDELCQKGLLTRAEFETQKQKLLKTS
jgi:hypothetical protein